MAVEFVTSINDYNLNRKQKIFAFFLKDKIGDFACCEKPNVALKAHYKPSVLDSLTLWRLNAHSFKPASILEGC